MISDTQSENENENSNENEFNNKTFELNNQINEFQTQESTITNNNSQIIIPEQKNDRTKQNDKLFHKLLINNLINVKEDTIFNKCIQ